jgi:ribosomal-protein-alanine N-acetyltransferase
MIIRPYSATDKTDCLEAFKSNMPEYFAPAELPDFESWLDQQAEPPAGDETKSKEQYYVAERAGKVIGCGGYYIDLTTQKAIMTWGMVLRSLHRQGIGKQLFEYRIALIKSISPGCIIVLDTSQHAYPFFQKLGFTITKITRDFYAKGIDRYDMELKVS